MTAPAIPSAIERRVSEIEDAVASGQMNAAMVFTKMRELLAPSSSERDTVIEECAKVAWSFYPSVAEAIRALKGQQSTRPSTAASDGGGKLEEASGPQKFTPARNIPPTTAPTAGDDYKRMVDAWVGSARDLARELGLPDDESKGSTHDWRYISERAKRSTARDSTPLGWVEEDMVRWLKAGKAPHGMVVNLYGQEKDEISAGKRVPVYLAPLSATQDTAK